jgi:hypothetical protein
MGAVLLVFALVLFSDVFGQWSAAGPENQIVEGLLGALLAVLGFVLLGQGASAIRGRATQATAEPASPSGSRGPGVLALLSAVGGFVALILAVALTEPGVIAWGRAALLLGALLVVAGLTLSITSLRIPASRPPAVAGLVISVLTIVIVLFVVVVALMG